MVKLLVEEGNYNPKDNHCDTPALSEAAALGKAETVEYLLQKGCDVETRDGPACETPICLAAENGHIATVRVLIKHGVNVNPVSQTGQMMYPLRLAIERYHIHTAMCLLAEMDLATLVRDPNQQDLLLCVAAVCGLEDLAQILLEYGCDPEAFLVDKGNIALHEEMSACMWAASFGHVKVIELLLNHGAGPDFPLSIAVEQEQLHAVKVLLPEGENCSVEFLHSAIHHAGIFRLILEHGVDFENDDEQECLFISAVVFGQAATVGVLLDFGFTIKKGIIDPTLAASTRGVNMLEFILQQKIIPPPSKDPKGHKAVHHTIHKGDITLLKLLHHHRCPIEPNHYPEYLKSAICVNSTKTFKSMLNILMHYSVNINSKFCRGQNCLWSAIIHGGPSHLRVLLEKGAEPLCRDDFNETPLMVASRADFSQGIKVLLPVIGSRISQEELVREVNKALEVARSHECERAIRALEQVYYRELPERFNNTVIVMAQLIVYMPF